MTHQPRYSDDGELINPTLVDAFSHHPPASDAVADLHAEVRRRALELAHFFDRHLPSCRETSIALTLVQQSMWAANAAVAIHGTSSAEDFERTMKQGEGVQGHRPTHVILDEAAEFEPTEDAERPRSEPYPGGDL